MEHDKKIKPETPDYIKFNKKILRKMCSHQNGKEATQCRHP
jgi:ribosomal protein L40E